MKSVGKQLQEARLAKNWTPELAARETKIKVERVRDLEIDDYSNFSSPTYARGFVRTYARSLGLDEYRILRQLDNKLPEDDNASFANETGLPYVPEPSKAVHASSANRTGLYIVLGLGFAVMLISAFVLFQAYRAGEFPRYFAASAPDNSTNAASSAGAPVVDSETPPQALPVNPVDTSHAERALPVDLNSVAATTDTNAAPAAPVAAAATNVAPAAVPGTAAPGVAVVAPAADDTSHALRALPVDPAALTNAAPASIPAASPAVPVPPAPVTVAAPPPAPVSPGPSPASARASNETGTKPPPRALPVDPSELIAAAQPTDAASPTPVVTTPVDLSPSAPSADATTAPAGKRLVLTASRDSFVRVTSLDSAGKEVLYASVLRAGQSLAFGGRKFSVNVGVPSAIDIALDGVNYGPHSDHDSPETFTLESHQP